jgi:putative tryptophan/tyrosine transport system substrate-binding protein
MQIGVLLSLDGTGWMRRRQFITLLGAAAAARPLGVRAQPSVRHISVLMPSAEHDSYRPAAAFEQGLAQRGWTSGRNVRIDWRWELDSTDKVKAVIAELLALWPDVVVASTSQTVAALRQAMPTTPIVFALIYDPVAQGFVQNLAHPGGNATGFTIVEATIGAKWLDLLLQMAPALTRVAYMCNPNNPGPLQPYAAAEAAARNQGVAVALAAVHGATDIETVMTTLAREPGGGLIVPPDGFLIKYSKLIVELAARHRLPAIYGFPAFAGLGGLASYGVEPAEQFRQAAVYVDRILRGEKPADLPVQQPTQYAMIINLKAARTLGLNIPPTVLVIADEVIE